MLNIAEDRGPEARRVDADLVSPTRIGLEHGERGRRRDRRHATEARRRLARALPARHGSTLSVAANGHGDGSCSGLERSGKEGEVGMGGVYPKTRRMSIMSRIIGEFEDRDGNPFHVLDTGEDWHEEDADDLRNATRRGRRRSGGRDHRADRDYPSDRYEDDDRPADRPAARSAAPRPRTQVTRPAVPVAARGNRAAAHDEDAPDAVTIKADKLVTILEMAGETAAELLPLPEPPPTPTGDLTIDLQNQTAHRQALHANRVLQSRIRTGGSLLSKVCRLLLD
jgi:hypothetical protein